MTKILKLVKSGGIKASGEALPGTTLIRSGQRLIAAELLPFQSTLTDRVRKNWKEEDVAHHWMAAVWPLDIPTYRKLLLVCLAFHSNEDGLCWPSVGLLTKECSMSRRGVQQSLAWLQKEGFIKREYRLGRSTYYRISEPAHHTRTRMRTTCAQNGKLNTGENKCVLSEDHPWHPGCTALPPPYWIGVSKRKKKL